MPSFTLTADLLQKIINNLASQPYGAVAGLIAEISQQTQGQAPEPDDVSDLGTNGGSPPKPNRKARRSAAKAAGA